MANRAGSYDAMTDKDHTGALSPPPHIPCPFVYANGRACSGHAVRFESYKADLTWSGDAEASGTSPSVQNHTSKYST
jgi:hypothetical protein